MTLFLVLLALATALYGLSELLFSSETRSIFGWLRAEETRKRGASRLEQLFTE